VLEFLVAILGGLEYLKDISLSARPLDKDLVSILGCKCTTDSRQKCTREIRQRCTTF
jgi:hypothetical protein